ncbi:MAG: hypothetical protein IPO21_02215 [Bacteroidales bacterium]|nr:hypothetical protein [Bacteroidales bacterium]
MQKPFNCVKSYLPYLFLVAIVSISGCSANSAKIPEIPTQTFIISPTKDTTLFGAKGVRLFIPANAFQLSENLSQNDSITIILSEFYKKSDFVLYDIYTVADNKILESEGMVHIDAKYKEESITLNPNKNLVIHFYKNNSYKEMNLYYSKDAASEIGVFNWQKATSVKRNATRLYMTMYEALASGYMPNFEMMSGNYSDSTYGADLFKLECNKQVFSAQTIEALRTNNGGNTIKCKVSKNGRLEDLEFVHGCEANAELEIFNFIKSLPDLKPCKDSIGNNVDLIGWITVSIIDSLPLYLADADYVKSFNTTYSNFEQIKIKNVKAANDYYHIFSVNKLGWIACMNEIESEIFADYSPNLPNSTELLKSSELKITLNAFNSIVKAQKIDNKFIFPNLPANQESKIVSFSKKSDNIKIEFLHVETGVEPKVDAEFYESEIPFLQEVVDTY